MVFLVMCLILFKPMICSSPLNLIQTLLTNPTLQNSNPPPKLSPYTLLDLNPATIFDLRPANPPNHKPTPPYPLDSLNA